MSFYEGLDAEKYDRQYKDRDLIKRISQFFAPYKKRLILMSVLILLMALLGASLPVFVSKGIDLVDVTAKRSSIYLIAGGVTLISFLHWLTNFFSRRVTMRTVADVLVDMSKSAFTAAAEHDLSFYDEFSSGKIVSRITSDTREFGNLVTLVTDLAAQIVESLIYTIIILNINVRLSVTLFALIPLIFLVTISLRSLSRKVTRQGMRAMATVNATIKETISGISVAKNFRQEDSIYGEFETANTVSYRVNVKRGFILTLVWPTMNLIGGVMTAVLVYYGGLTVVEGMVTAGTWYLFILSIDRFLNPVMSLSSFWTQVQTGLSAAERVFALIDAEQAVIQTANEPVSDLKGEIRFEHVGFQYKTNEIVLEDFSLDIRAGENIALVGHTGAGKSSIIKLIARFYEFQGGKILVDGKDIRQFDLTSYRKQLGIVTQAPFLFSESILDNIRYGSPQVSDQEIERISRQIGGGEWLDALPDGLHTQVGERGALLSMGQRQLVALMRVLVQKPAIFILDEATASVDPFTEWQIQQALDLILQRSTSILIAHRLSTVRSADRIIALQNGKIIEVGSHDGLILQGGYYASLYNTYFRHQSLDYKPAGLEEYLQSKVVLKPGSNQV
ncbi:MAG: ABC transporter ATP-binding protein/permease [Chloroflexi bacterium]|nr:ABC transporter ATP-binding protein/permease [Chloroflexota bacterium]